MREKMLRIFNVWRAFGNGEMRPILLHPNASLFYTQKSKTRAKRR